MTRRDRTQPGSLAEHAVTGVRYCGGCNPRYDRTALVGRLAERCPNVRFVRAEAGREYDALLVVGGAPLAKAWRHAEALRAQGKTVELCYAAQEAEIAALAAARRARQVIREEDAQ